MKNYIRKLAFRLGVKNTDTILSPIARIVEDLEAFDNHVNEELGQTVLAQFRLHERAEQLVLAKTQALNARRKVSALIVEAA